MKPADSPPLLGQPLVELGHQVCGLDRLAQPSPSPEPRLSQLFVIVKTQASTMGSRGFLAPANSRQSFQIKFPGNLRGERLT